MIRSVLVTVHAVLSFYWRHHLTAQTVHQPNNEQGNQTQFLCTSIRIRSKYNITITSRYFRMFQWSWDNSKCTNAKLKLKWTKACIIKVTWAFHMTTCFRRLMLIPFWHWLIVNRKNMVEKLCCWIFRNLKICFLYVWCLIKFSFLFYFRKYWVLMSSKWYMWNNKTAEKSLSGLPVSKMSSNGDVKRR